MFVEHKESVEVTEQPAKVLKLSEAMRIGAALRPQGKCMLFSRGSSCALGAAYEGVTGKSVAHYLEVYDLFPVLRNGHAPSEITTEIWHRNDSLDWSREQIADWLQERGY